MDWRVVGVPTDDLIRDALKIEKGSGKPNSEKILEKLSQTQLTQIAEAKAEAQATTERLKPFDTADANKVFVVALLEAAKTGKLGTINLTSDLYAAIAGVK